VDQVVAALPLEGGRVGGFILEIAPSPGDLSVLQFTLARLALQLKAATPSPGPVTVVFPPGLVRGEQALSRRVAAYADLLGVGFGPEWRADAEWIRDQLGNRVVLKAGPASGADGLATSYLDVVAESGDGLIDTLWSEEATAGQASAVCGSIQVLSDVLGAASFGARLDQASATLASDGGPLVSSAFVDSSSTSSAFLVRADGAPGRPRRISVSPRGAGAVTVSCRDALDGRTLATRPVGKPGTTAVHECASEARYVVVSIQRQDTDERVYEWVSVTGKSGLRVEEIVARWQQYRAAQQRDLDNYVADCLLSLHFATPLLGSGFDVALELRQLVDRSGQRDWVQRGFLVNGVRFGDPKGFSLPQLEPEKVVAQPLELALQEKYRYTLLGTDTVDGVPTYVVGIEPQDPKAVLFTGKVWIDGVTFREVRMQLEQRGGRSSILSQVETQEYHLVPSGGGREFNLLRSITSRQLASAAGRSILVERTYRFSGYQINSPAFAAARAEAMASDLRMYRDTDEGLRILRREGDTRVVEPPKSKVRSLVGGVLYDGAFDFPIPLAGFSLVDYDFRRTGAELSVFFAGPILATNVTKKAGERFRYGMDLALSAIPQTNRVFEGDEEVVGESVYAFEETVGLRASWQARPGVNLAGSSYLSMNLFNETGDTDPSFAASGTGFTVQTSGELKLTRSGFTLTGSALRGDRLGWPAIGAEDLPTSFVKYWGEASKQFYLGKFTKAAVNASYYGGERLDRFSRYQPSFLVPPRIRGIPSGTDTFDAVGVAGVQFGFNAMDVVWVEAMYDHAWGRNLDESSAFREFDGLQLDVGTVGPWGTFVKGSVTYALRGSLERYNNRWGVYLLVFKALD
jgi:hypothetical protein